MPIPLVKDPMLVELELIVTTQLAMPCGFLHANLLEANFGLDQVSKDSQALFPVCIHVATGKNKNDSGNGDDFTGDLITRKASVYLLLLQKYDAPTSDFESKDVNPLVYQMHQLGNNLKYWINKSPLSINGGVSEWEMVDIYQKFDSHLFGQGVTFTWEMMTNSTGYLNRAY